MDSSILLWFNSWMGRSEVFDMFVGVVASDYLAPVWSSLVLMALWFEGPSASVRFSNQLLTIAGALAVGLANAQVALVNALVNRARPFADLDIIVYFYRPTDSSFPANTSAVGFAIATTVFLRHRKIGTALYALVLLWGLARISVGVHYPSDVLFGAVIGVLGAFLANWIILRSQFLFRPLLQCLRSLCMA